MSKKSYITYDEQAHEYEGQAKRLENFRTQLQQSQNSPSHSPTQLYQQHPSTHTPTHQQQSPLKSNGLLQQYQPPHFLPQQQTGYETQPTTQGQIASSIYLSPYTESLKIGSAGPVQYNGPDYGQPAEQRGIDPMIYPGLYSPSGIDMLSILIRVHQRPNPTFDLGFVDSSCALLLCSLTLQDTPIVYVSDAFTKLTGYSAAEILGENCRFLQYPPSSPLHPFSSSIPHDSLSDEMKKEEFYKYHDEEDRQEIIKLRESIRAGKEARTVLRNYKKDGEGFANCLTTVPIVWEGNRDGQKRFIVGFQADGNAKRS